MLQHSGQLLQRAQTRAWVQAAKWPPLQGKQWAAAAVLRAGNSLQDMQSGPCRACSRLLLLLR